MQKSSKICESSLRWILGLRMRADQHNYKRKLLIQYPEAFTNQHTYGSMRWSIIQANKIDKIGLDQWLKTPDALGYDNVRERFEILEDRDACVIKEKTTTNGFGVSPDGVPVYPIMK